MSQNMSDRNKAIVAVLVVLAIIGLTIYFGMKWMNQSQLAPVSSTAVVKEPSEVSSPSSTTQSTPPIDYKKDDNLMTQRKTELGFDKGIDMIVRPGETMKIGEALVSVDEVLDKIRLKTGAIDERNIDSPSGAATVRRLVKLPAALEKLKLWDQELTDIKNQLADTGQPLTLEKEDKLRQRQQEITPKVHTYRYFREAKNKLEALKQAQAAAEGEKLAEINTQIAALKKELQQLEEQILISVGSSQDLEAYGIYVVKTSDNIWNIHFQFLKDYFTHKGVQLSPMADEPTSAGESSGVGRLLKFSETMVHIYNIREKKLAQDLHLIHPLNKIVVFNLGRVFALLESIDYNEVSRIRFDGETLWLPARNE